MLFIEEKELQQMLQAQYKKGIEIGIKLMQKRMLLACENGNPIELDGRAYFVKADIQNLKQIFYDLENKNGKKVIHYFMQNQSFML